MRQTSCLRDSVSHSTCFQKGQAVRARAVGEAFFDTNRGSIRKWEPWTISVAGPKGYCEASGDDNRLSAKLPASGRYSFDIGPCAVWENRGKIEICASPVGSDATDDQPRSRERVAVRPTPSADTDAGTTLVSMTGRCDRFSIGTIELSCNKIAYMHVPKTGRTSFNIPHENGALGLSGGRDIQPTPENYVLSVDSVLNGKGDGTSDR